ncbi:MAG: methyl-accepting chemotaxis protein [Bacillota bacterium]
MKWFYDLKISAKLFTGFGLVLLMMLGTCLYLILSMRGIDAGYSELISKKAYAGIYANAALANYNDGGAKVRAYIIGGDSSYIDKYQKAVSEGDAYLNKVAPLLETDEGKRLFKEFQDKVEAFKQYGEKSIALVKAREESSGAARATAERKLSEYLNSEKSVIGAMTEAGKAVVSRQEQRLDSGMAENTASVNKTVMLSTVVAIIVLLLGLTMIFLISRIISKPVGKLAQAAEKLANGDVNVTVEAQTKDEIGVLSLSFKTMVENLKGLVDESLTLSKAAVEGHLQTRGNADKFKGSYREIVKGVNDTLDAVLNPINEAAGCLKEMAKGNLNVAVTGDYKGDHAIIKDALNTTIDSVNEILEQVTVAVDQVAKGARQISDSSQALSQGASETASSLEETTSSMQEITAQTKQNAENATQANQLAGQARVSAEKGNGQMVAMVSAMNDINESAANISKIIKAIDEIAFQTNLLALNAAVEAARAGKHGKGFAVVAEEVRNLAERSAKAAKETAEMIEGSIKKTEAGTKIVEETSEALGEIVLGATKVTDLIGEIASASKEQAFGIEQINQGLSQVDQVTQQNTASAEELAASSEELSSQAVQLKQMLGKFKLRQIQQAYQMQGIGQSHEAASQTWGKGALEAAATSSMKEPVKGGKKPGDVITLDDKEFGKF